METHQKKTRFEQKITGRCNIRKIFLLFTMPGHLYDTKRASEYIL